MKHKRRILIIGMILVVILLTGGISYAWLTFNAESSKSNTLQVGNLKLALQDTTGIQLLNAVPMSDANGMKTEAYTFDLQNTGTVDS